MTFEILFVVAGLVFIAMALAGSVLQRLPLTTSLLYLAVGVAIGPVGVGLLDIDPVAEAAILERMTEVVVIVSLFTAGLKLRLEWRDPKWHLPVRLASVSMTVTVVLIAAVGVVGLGLPLGAAVLLGAVLAPTDPVLASDVQVEDPTDRDQLRFGLTGEAGLNDGTAFPFVMLGLGLLGHHELGAGWWRWVAVDIVWACAVGLGVGALLGTAIGHLVLHLRQRYRSAVGLDDFLTLGLIALSYGVALVLHGYGFLAVFAAGLAVRRLEQRLSGAEDEELLDVPAGGAAMEAATAPETAPVYMAQALLGFNEQLERIGEVAVVVLVGAVLFSHGLPGDALWFVPVLLLGIRPLAVVLGVGRRGIPRTQRRLIAWFGIRGIGSLYYLTYAIEHGVEEGVAAELTGLVLSAMAVSIVVHGVSVTPLMGWYGRRSEQGAA